MGKKSIERKISFSDHKQIQSRVSKTQNYRNYNVLFYYYFYTLTDEQSHTFWIIKGKMIHIFEPFHSFISVQSSVQ